jgi:hypothetical protein
MSPDVTITLGGDRPEEARCDFCCQQLYQQTVWTYPCESFTPGIFQIPGRLIHESITDWAACEHCHMLIEQRAWDTLAKRCVEHFDYTQGMSRTERRLEMKRLKALHLEFQRHRRGPPYQMPAVG